MKPLMWWGVFPLLLIIYTGIWLTPATWWYKPVSIRVHDAFVGEDPVVSINRQIKRGFDGRYTVSVWMDPPDGHVACAGSDTLRYKGGLYVPHDAPLTQWADDPWCSKLKPGKYYVEACWTILRPFKGIVPGKTVCITSNLFEIKNRG